jgi:hypothetical protein
LQFGENSVFKKEKVSSTKTLQSLNLCQIKTHTVKTQTTMRGMLAPSSTESFASTPKIMMIKSIQFSVRQFSKQRPLTVALSSSEKSPIAQAVIGIASASALAAAAFVLIRNNASASASSPSRRRPSRNEETPLEDSNRNNNTNHMMSTSVFSTLQQQQQYSDSSSEKKPRWMQLGWKRSADAELALIEAKRAREAAHELEFWDRRWKLRKKTLPELRNMAAYVYF